MAKRFSSKLVRELFGSSKHTPGLEKRPHPNAITTDYIGPPDALSNLRPIVRHSVKGFERTETDLEYSLRIRREATEKWNQEFWTKHNQRFVESKEDFINAHKLEHKDAPNADEMSEFYKEFLDKNWRIHFLYNISWYSKNADMLLLALQVNLERGIGYLKRGRESTS